MHHQLVRGMQRVNLPWVSMFVISTLIWACWMDGAAATKEPRRRVKGMARCILEFRQVILGEISTINIGYSLAEVCDRNGEEMGREWGGN